MNRPVYFQLPAVNPEKLATFYADIFGWEKQAMPGMEDIWFLISGPEDTTGMNGCIMSKSMFDCTTNMMEVADLDLYMQKIQDNGGKITTPKHRVPDMGFFAWCTDPEGNPFSIGEYENPDQKTNDAKTAREAINRPIHFEIPASNPAKLAEFYANVFGWDFEKFDPNQEYYLIQTGAFEEAGINGAIMERGDFKCTVNTMGVDDIDEYLEKVTAHGGTIKMPKTEIPNIGMFAYCIDIDDNVFGIIQPQM
jgi:predicted enzyme related to lactoylglutathione lyase